MNKLEWINAVVGKPWVDRAAGPDSFDCWGLVLDSFLRVDGVSLPSVDGYTEALPIEVIGAPVCDAYGWPEVNRPVDGAVFCVFLSNGDMVHVGRIFSAGSAGLQAVHAAGRDGQGQVAAEPAGALVLRYKNRIKYFVRPANA